MSDLGGGVKSLGSKVDELGGKVDKLADSLQPDGEPEKGIFWRIKALEVAAAVHKSTSLKVLAWVLRVVTSAGLISVGAWLASKFAEKP